MKPVVFALLALAQLSAVAAGPTVWRCGPDGKTYSDTPCPGGQPVNADDSRSAQQRAEAQDVAARDRQLAQDLQAERARRESAQGRAGSGLAALGVAPPPAVKPKKAKGKAKKPKPPPEETDIFRGAAPGSP